MAKQLNVNVAVTANTAQAKAQLQDLQNKLSQLSSTSANLKIGVNTGDIQKASQAAIELAAHLKQATNVDTGTLNFAKLNNSITSSGKTLSAYGDQLLKLGPQGQQAFQQLAQAVSQSEIPVKRLSNLFGEFGTVLKNTVRWQISSSLIHGFMGAIQGAYNYAQDLNESLNRIQIVTQQSDAQMAKFAETANKAAKALSTTTTTYTDAALIYYQQGLSAKEVEERTNVTIKMANAAGVSAKTVSDQMTAVWNNFADGSKSLEYYADVMTALGAATASSTDEISKGLEKFASVADTVGLSYENAAAALATITATTRQSADSVGTGLRTLFSRLESVKLGKTLEDGVGLTKYSQALQSVGVDILDANGELKRMDTILEDLGDRWQTLNDTQKTALAQTVGGVRQYTTLIALMDNFDFYKRNQQTALGSEGTVQKQADIYAQSWEAAQKRVRASAETIYSDILNDKFFIEANNNIAKFLEIIDKVINSLGGLKGVLSTLGTVATGVFRNELTTGIYNFGVGVKQAFTPAKKLEQQRTNFLNEAASKSLGVQIDPNTKMAIGSTTENNAINTKRVQYFQQQIDLQNRYAAQQNRMTPIDKIAAQSVLDQYNNTRQAYEKSLEQHKDQIINSVNKRGSVVDSAKLINMAEMTDDFNSKYLSPSNQPGGKPTLNSTYYTELSAELNKLGPGIEKLEKFQSLMNEFNKNGNANVNDLVEGFKELSKETGTKFDTTGFEAGLDTLEEIQAQWDQARADLIDTLDIGPDKIQSIADQFHVDPDLLNEYVIALQNEGREAAHTKELEAQLNQERANANAILDKHNIGMELSKLAGQLTTAAMGVSSFVSVGNNMYETITNISNGSIEASEGLTALISQFGSLAMVLPSLLATLGPVGTLLTLIAGAGIVAYQQYTKAHHQETNEELLERLTKDAETAKERAQEASKAYENLLSNRNQHNELLDTLNSLTEGTEEFRNALIEANDVAQELINGYNLQYGTDYSFDSRGAIQINQNTLDAKQQEALTLKEKEAQNSLMANIAQGSAEAKAQAIDAAKKAFGNMTISEDDASQWWTDNIAYGLNSQFFGGAVLPENYSSANLASVIPGLLSGYAQALQDETVDSFQDYWKALAPNGYKDKEVDYTLTKTDRNILASLRSGQFTGEFIESAIKDLTGIDNLDAYISDKAPEYEAWQQRANNQIYQLFGAQAGKNGRGNNIIDRQLINSLAASNGNWSANNFLKQLEEEKNVLDSANLFELQEIYQDIYGFLPDTNDVNQIKNAIAYQKIANKMQDEYTKASDAYYKKVGYLYQNTSELTGKQINELQQTNQNLTEEEKRIVDLANEQAARELMSSGRNLIDTATGLGISEDFLSQIPLATDFSKDDLDYLNNIAHKVEASFGKGEATRNIVETLLEGFNDHDNELVDAIKDINFTGDAIEDLTKIKQLTQDNTIRDIGNQQKIQDIFDSALKDIGGKKGIFEQLYGSEAFADDLKKLQKTFKKTREVSGADIAAIAESSEYLADMLDLSDITAQGLADTLESLWLGDIGVDDLTDSLLAAFSAAGELENNLSEVYSYIDNFQQERSVKDIGKFYKGLASDIEDSLNAGMTLDPQLLQAWGEIFGEQSLSEYRKYMAELSSLNLSDYEFNEKFNEHYKDEIVALQALQKDGNLKSLFQYYGDKRANGLSLSDVFSYTEEGQVRAADNGLLKRYGLDSESGFINWLQKMGISEQLSKAMAGEYAATNADVNQLWRKTAAKNGVAELIGKKEENEGRLLTAKQLDAFYKQYSDVLTNKQGDSYKNFQDFFTDIAAQARAAGVAVLDLSDDFNINKASLGDLAKQLSNSQMDLEEFVSLFTGSNKEKLTFEDYEQALTSLGATANTVYSLIDEKVKENKKSTTDFGAAFKETLNIADDKWERFQTYLSDKGLEGNINAENWANFLQVDGLAEQAQQAANIFVKTFQEAFNGLKLEFNKDDNTITIHFEPETEEVEKAAEDLQDKVDEAEERKAANKGQEEALKAIQADKEAAAAAKRETDNKWMQKILDDFQLTPDEVDSLYGSEEYENFSELYETIKQQQKAAKKATDDLLTAKSLEEFEAAAQQAEEELQQWIEETQQKIQEQEEQKRKEKEAKRQAGYGEKIQNQFGYSQYEIDELMASGQYQNFEDLYGSLKDQAWEKTLESKKEDFDNYQKMVQAEIEQIKADKLEAEIASSKAVTEAQTKIDALNTEITTLKSRLQEDAVASQEMIDAATKAASEAQTQLENTQNQLTQLQAQVQANEEQINTATSENEKLQLQIENLQLAKQVADTELELAKEQFNSASATAKETLARDLAAAKEELNAELEAEIESIKGREEARIEAIKAVEKAQIDGIKLTYEAEKAKIQADMSLSEAEKIEKIAELTAQYEADIRMVKEKAAEDMAKAADDAKAELAKAQEGYNNDLATTTAELTEELNAALAKAEADVDAASKAAEAKAAEAEAKAAEAETKVEEAQKELDAALQAKAEAEKEVEAARKEVKEAEAKYGIESPEYQAAIDRMNTAVAELDARVKAAEAAKEAAETARAAAETAKTLADEASKAAAEIADKANQTRETLNLEYKQSLAELLGQYIVSNPNSGVAPPKEGSSSEDIDKYYRAIVAIAEFRHKDFPTLDENSGQAWSKFQGMAGYEWVDDFSDIKEIIRQNQLGQGTFDENVDMLSTLVENIDRVLADIPQEIIDKLLSSDLNSDSSSKDLGSNDDLQYKEEQFQELVRQRRNFQYAEAFLSNGKNASDIEGQARAYDLQAQSSAAIDQILKNLDMSQEDYQKLGQQLDEGLAEGILTFQDGVLTAANDVGTETLDEMKSTFGIASPSTKTREMGQNLDEGLAQGIQKNTASVVTAAAEMALQVITAISQVLSGNASYIQELINSLMKQQEESSGDTEEEDHTSELIERLEKVKSALNSGEGGKGSAFSGLLESITQVNTILSDIEKSNAMHKLSYEAGAAASQLNTAKKALKDMATYIQELGNNAENLDMQPFTGPITEATTALKTFVELFQGEEGQQGGTPGQKQKGGATTEVKVNYVKEKQEEPEDKEAKVNYTLGDQDPPVDMSAVVNYTKGDQEKPEDMEAKVNYVRGTQEPPLAMGIGNGNGGGGGRASGMNNTHGFAGGQHLNNDYEGLATVGELGPELMIHGDQAYLVGTHGRMLTYVSQGDKIYTAAQTQKIMENNPPMRDIPGFSQGYQGIRFGWSGGGGGSGSRGSAGKKTKEFDPERYHYLTKQIELLTDAISELSEILNDAFGTQKLDIINDQIEAVQRLVQKYDELNAEARMYEQVDIQALKDAGVWDNIVLDDKGYIANYDELQIMYAKAAADIDTSDLKGDEKEEAEAYKKELENDWALIKKYEETHDKIRQAVMDRDKQARELLRLEDKRIEIYVDLKINLDERKIKYVDDYISHWERVAEHSAGLNKVSKIFEQFLAGQDKIASLRQALSNAEAEKAEQEAKIKKYVDQGIIQYDEYGRISNYKELMEKYNLAGMSEEDKSLLTPEEREMFQTIRNSVKAIEQTEEQIAEITTDLEEEMYDQTDRIINMIDSQIQAQISADENSIKFLDHLLNKVDDDIYKAADAFAIVNKKLQTYGSEIAHYRTGISQILAQARDENGNEIVGLTVDKVMSMSTDELKALHLDAGMIDKIEEYTDAILECQEAMEELEMYGVDKLKQAFDELNAQVKESIGLFSHYEKLLNGLKDVADLQGFGYSQELQDTIHNLNQSLFENTKNEIKSYQSYYNELATERQKIIDYLNDPNSKYTENQKKGLEEQIKHIEEEMRSAQESVLDLWKEGLEVAKEMVEQTLKEIKRSYEEEIAGAYGSLEALKDAYDRENEIDEQYVDDYEKLYQLSKLQRNLTRDIDERAKNGFKNNKNLQNLLNEIEKVRASGAEMSEYELTILEKRYEYEKALAELEDSRNAKSIVRLQRDKNGNWGYVYTTVEDEAEQQKREQEVEDKLYEWQKTSVEYTHEMTNRKWELERTIEEKYQDILSRYQNGDITTDQYNREIQALNEYRDNMESYFDSQIGISLDDAHSTLETAKNRYKDIAFDILDTFSETTLGAVTAAASANDLTTATTIAMTRMQLATNEAIEAYHQQIEMFNEFVQQSSDDFTTFANKSMTTINQLSHDQVGVVQQDIDTMADLIWRGDNNIMDLMADFNAKYVEAMGEAANSNDKFLASMYDVVAGLRGVKSEMGSFYSSLQMSTEPLNANPNSNDKKSGLKDVPVPAGNLVQDYYAKRSFISSTDGRMKLVVDEAMYDYLMTYKNMIEEYSKQGYDVIKEGSQEDLLNRKTSFEDILDSQIAALEAGIGNLQTNWEGYEESFADTLTQEITINADFPNATNHSEIEEAFNNLVNKATQYTNRKT